MPIALGFSGKHLRAVSAMLPSVALAIWCMIPAPSHAVPFKDDFRSSPLGSLLEAMPENRWAKANINSFSDVWMSPSKEPAGGFGSPHSIIEAWSSMAWDSNRGDLVFWGGGHANYAGNEVYRWRGSTLEWERASLPSEVVRVDDSTARYETVDGPLNAPVSSHTYDNQVFLGVADRFATFGGAAWNTGGSFTIEDENGVLVRTGPYFWDPSRANGDAVGGLSGSGVDPSDPGGQMWENRNNINVLPPGVGGFVEGTTAATQENGKDVVYIEYGRGLWKMTVNDVNDPSQDTYEQVGSRFASYSGGGAGDYDPSRNIYLRSHNTGFTFFDLNSAGPGNRNQMVDFTDLTGGLFSPGAGLGLVYDKVRERFVVWDGNDNLFALIAPEIMGPDGWAVSLIDPIGLIAPAADSIGIFRGVLGKFEYLDGLDVFAGVIDATSGDVWFYKPENWSPELAGIVVAVSEPAAAISLAGGFLLLILIGRARRRSGALA